MGRDKQVQSGQRKPMGIGKALVQNPALRAGFCGTRLAGVNGRWVLQK